MGEGFVVFMVPLRLKVGLVLLVDTSEQVEGLMLSGLLGLSEKGDMLDFWYGAVGVGFDLCMVFAWVDWV